VRSWLLLMLLSPLTGPGSLILTPDVPLLFFWSLSVLVLDRAFERPRFRDSLLLGLTLGLGFTSKYHIVLFGPAALAAVLVCRRWAWFRPDRVAGLLVGLAAGAAPVLLWNAANDWVSFGFQLRHGLGGEAWNPSWTLDYLGGQLLILFPPIAWFAFRRRPRGDTWLLWLLGVVPLGFFLLTSFKGRVEANWTTVAYPPLLALAVIHGLPRRVLRFVLVFWAVGLALVLSDVAGRWAPLDPPPKTREYERFEALAEIDVETVRPLYARSYQMASQMAWAHRRPVYKLRGMNRVDFFDFRPESLPTTGRYFVVLRREERLPEWARDAGHEVRRRTPVDDRHEIAEVHAPEGG
jgi:4-amino-4-deoxy-L-arabinose transferase-like glycosyltransferase